MRAHPIAMPGGSVGRGGIGRAGTSSPRTSVLRDYAGGILTSVTPKGASQIWVEIKCQTFEADEVNLIR